MTKYLPITLLAAVLSAFSFACGGTSTATPASPSTVDDSTDAVLTDGERRKIDAPLAERWEKGHEPLPVKVRFAGSVPSDSVLADLLLTRVGAVVVGQVTRDGLKRILARDDVERVTFYSGAGYDGDDDLG